MIDVTGCILIDARSAGPRLPRQLAVVAPLARADAFSLRVIDDTGDPRLPPIVERYGARLLNVSPAPLGHRLNDAITRISGEVLIFPGIGNTTSAEALSRLAIEIATGTFDVALLNPLQRNSWQRLLERIKRRPRPRSEGMCLSRGWFERIGGCDPALDAGALGELLERLCACGARVKPVEP